MQRVAVTLLQASTSESGSMGLRTAQDCLEPPEPADCMGETHVHCYNACNSHNETFAICASRSIWTDEHRLMCSAAADQFYVKWLGCCSCAS